MSTLHDIIRAAEGPVSTCVDATTPSGHFLTTTKVLSLAVTYLLRGTESDMDAPIVGRTEYPPVDPSDRYFGSHPAAYKGDRIKGGTLLPRFPDSAAAFASMARTA